MDVFGPSTLDVFDPFDELDRTMSRNMMWLTQPDWMTDLSLMGPRVPEKHRITLDITGFDPNSIKTEIKDKTKLVVTGREGAPSESGDYSLKEFRKTYNLPNNIETDKLISFVTGDGLLVIEFPFKREERGTSDLLPRIVEAGEAGKRVELNVAVPLNIDPSKIHVTCKDRDVIVRANYKDEKPDKISRIHYYRRSTFPTNTDFDNLKCVYENNKLSITAPLTTEQPRLESKQQQQQLTACPTCQTPTSQQAMLHRKQHQVPIEIRGQQGMIGQQQQQSQTGSSQAQSTTRMES
jgi:HSP20 family molecular chaperone IbpA